MSIRIENWCVKRETSAFRAPELLRTVIVGKIYGDKNFEDGSDVNLQLYDDFKVNGKIISSKNDTYHLGEPEPEYVKWMKENNIAFDPENPIKIRKV